MKILPLGENANDPTGVAIFYEVEDETMEIIKKSPDYCFDRKFVNRCFMEKGRNAHLYLLINNGNIKEIVRKLRGLMEQYKTVSWWTVEHKKFYIRSKSC
jgi:hypothetical protein